MLATLAALCDWPSRGSASGTSPFRVGRARSHRQSADRPPAAPTSIHWTEVYESAYLHIYESTNKGFKKFLSCLASVELEGDVGAQPQVNGFDRLIEEQVSTLAPTETAGDSLIILMRLVTK